jgi:hypothetical protein
MILSRAVQRSVEWAQNLRVRVGQSVKLNGSTWSSLTGINSEPQDGSPNWQLINRNLNTVLVNGNLMNLSKKPGNVSDSIQAGDMISDGWWSSSKYIMQAIYLTGDINTLSSWDIINDY